MHVVRAVWLGLIVLAANASSAEGLPFTLGELKHAHSSWLRSTSSSFSTRRPLCCMGRSCRRKTSWTTPEEIKSRKPAPWGYGSRIADTALHCGHTLVALLDAHDAVPDPYLRRKAEELYSALKFIGGVCPVEGLVPRGPHPNDPSAYYDDSSMDQHTTYIIALARYANSDLATAEDKQWIAEKLGAIGRRLEKYDFSIKAADGVTESHVGFSWKGFRNNHVSILIPTLYALYKGTGDEHWLKLHDHFLAERDGLRWQRLHTGDHVELNGHPIYANQNGFRLNAYLHFLEDAEKRSGDQRPAGPECAGCSLIAISPDRFTGSITVRSVGRSWPESTAGARPSCRVRRRHGICSDRKCLMNRTDCPRWLTFASRSAAITWY